MKNTLAVALLGLVVLSACGKRPDAASTTAPTPADAKLNARSTVTGSTSERPPGQSDAEDPKTGTNSARPDSPKDLKPGTDGNTNPPAR